MTETPHTEPGAGDPSSTDQAPPADQGLVDPARRGLLELRDKVLVRIAEHAAVTGPDGVIATGRLLGHGLPHAQVTQTGGHLSGTVHIALAWRAAAAGAAGAVRQVVIEQLTGLTGLTVDRLDVVIDQVVPADQAAPARRRVT